MRLQFKLVHRDVLHKEWKSHCYLQAQFVQVYTSVNETELL